MTNTPKFIRTNCCGVKLRVKHDHAFVFCPYCQQLSEFTDFYLQDKMYLDAMVVLAYNLHPLEKIPSRLPITAKEIMVERILN